MQTIFIYSDFLSYKSTLESIELIYDKYNNKRSDANPDVPALEAAYLSLLGKGVTAQIGFSRYNVLYERYLNGEIDYSLEPNRYLNIGNILSIVAYAYLLEGVKGIYDRDLSQPILGI